MFRFTVIILLLVAGLPARGQIDLKVDFGPVFFAGIGVAADFGMGDQHAFVAGVNYLATDYNSEFYEYRNIQLVPEYRFFLSPVLGADRWFVGGYGVLELSKAREWQTEGPHTNGRRGMAGLLVGYKHVSTKGNIVEVNLGLGRAGEFSGDRQERLFSRAFDDFSGTHFRIGILLGRRVY